jgi:hypothetical protein
MQNVDHNIGFWEKRQFFAENCQKSQKNVIITSTPEETLSLKLTCSKFDRSEDGVEEDHHDEDEDRPEDFQRNQDLERTKSCHVAGS